MTTTTTEGVTPAMIEAGKDAYTRWQQNSEPTEQSLGEAIYLAMDAARSTDPSVAKMRAALEEARLIVANLPHDESAFLAKIDAALLG